MSIQQRRAREREELREDILEAARTMFVKDGYENVSIRKLADRIEYSPGTIYLYFKDKADIFDTLCEQTFAKLRKRMQGIAEDTGDPLERLRRAGRAYIDFAIENPNEYMVTFVAKQERSQDEVDITRLQTSGMACFDCLRNLVRQGIEEDRIRFTDVEEVSQSLWATMHGVAVLLITCCGFPFIEHSRLVERTVDIAIEGIRKR